MSTIAVLHGNGKAYARLRRAIAIDSVAGARHRIEQFREWGPFVTGLRGLQSAEGVIGVFDAYHAGEYGIAYVEQLRRERPSVPLIVYSNFSGRPAQEAARLVIAGVSRLITLDIDDHPAQIRDALAAADSNVHTEIANLFSALAGAEVAQLLVHVYDAVAEAMHAVNGDHGREGNGQGIAAIAQKRLAEAMGARRQRRDVERKMISLKLPPPAETVQLVRLINVGRLLDDPDRTVANVAVATGFVETTLYRVVKQTTGLTPDGLRKAGALATILRVIEQHLCSTQQRRREHRSGNGERQGSEQAHSPLSQTARILSLPDSFKARRRT